MNSVWKSKDITLLTKVLIVKVMVFPVVMYGCESWTIKKVEHWRIDAFKLWCWRGLLRVPWTARRSNQSIPKESNPEYSLEGLILKLQYLVIYEKSWPWKRPWCWERLKVGGEGDDRAWDGWMASLTPWACCRPLLSQSFPASGSFPVSHSSHQVAIVLEFQLQHQSFPWIFTDCL